MKKEVSTIVKFMVAPNNNDIIQDVCTYNNGLNKWVEVTVRVVTK